MIKLSVLNDLQHTSQELLVVRKFLERVGTPESISIKFKYSNERDIETSLISDEMLNREIRNSLRAYMLRQERQLVAQGVQVDI